MENPKLEPTDWDTIREALEKRSEEARRLSMELRLFDERATFTFDVIEDRANRALLKLKKLGLI
jgi:hypothetical protein